MAQQFTLKLHNPDIDKNPNDLIYMGLNDGNKLNLEITNNSGFDLQFDAQERELLVKFSKEVLDESSAKGITVKSPWATNGIYTPEDDPNPADQKKYYVLRLKLADAASTVAFPDKGTLTIALAAIKPIATGTATLKLYHDFEDDIRMDAANQLSILASGNNKKTLIGPNQSLGYRIMVNDSNDTNPIVATATNVPVTSDNAAENTIHLNFFFQNPETTESQGNMGQLVPSWDPNHPPTFKLRFPYFNGDSPDPAYADLTNDFKVGEPNYNTYTSAWNILLSLDSKNPNVTTNDWWKITAPTLGSSSPYWLIQPTPANKYLFTGTYGPGPFLDLYFSHIYSNLPVSSNSPETQIILESLQFPGFNDNVWPKPLFKEDSVQILSFGGNIQYTPSSGTVLTLTWETKNADHCFIKGDATQQGSKASGKDYTKAINNANPLSSAYTITAYDKQGVSKISRTINVKWKADDAKVFPISQSFQMPTAIDISPSADKVYVAGGIKDAKGSIVISILDGQTLVASPNPILLPNDEQPKNVGASADNTKIMVAALSLTGDEGKVYGFSTSNPPSLIPGSPLTTNTNSLPNLYEMCISEDSSTLFLSAPYTSVPTFIEAIDTGSIKPKPTTGNPANIKGLGPIGLSSKGNNLFCPIIDGDTTSGGLGILNSKTLAPIAGSPISLRSDPKGVKYTAGPLLVSQDGNTVTTIAQGYDVANNYATVFILCQVDIPSMKLSRRIQIFNGYPNSAPTPTTNLLYSDDEKYIFIFGLNFSKEAKNNDETLVSVYDASSLKELSWSPIATPLSDTSKTFVVNMKMAPNGARIYALTLDSSTSEVSSGAVRAFIPYLEASSNRTI